MGRELPYMAWFPNDWLGDPGVTVLSLASRAVWFDLLCAMHLRRTGTLCEAPEILRRLARCTADELASAIDEFETSGTATVVRERNGRVSITCRRIDREIRSREKNREYVAKHREKSRSGPKPRPPDPPDNPGSTRIGKTDVRSPPSQTKPNQGIGELDLYSKDPSGARESAPELRAAGGLGLVGSDGPTPADFLERIGIADPTRSQLATADGVTTTILAEMWRQVNVDAGRIESGIVSVSDCFVSRVRTKFGLKRIAGNRLTPEAVDAMRGITALRHTKFGRVAFGDVDEERERQRRKNIERNGEVPRPAKPGRDQDARDAR